MVDQLTPRLQYRLQTTGGNDNSWGSLLNTTISNLDISIGGTLSLNMAAGDVTLDTDQNRFPLIDCSGALTADTDLIVLSLNNNFWIYNGTTGSFALTVKTAAGTGVEIAQGTWRKVYCDGTNVYAVSDLFLETGGTIDGDVSINGNLTLQGSASNLTPRFRLTSGNGLNTSYSDFIDLSSTVAQLLKISASGNAFLEIEARPSDGSSSSTITFNKGTGTTGDVEVQFWRGDGSANVDHILASGTSGTLVRLCQNGGDVEINGSLVVPNGQGVPSAVLEDQKPANTGGGTFTSGAWRTRDLNTEVRDVNGLVTLSANQFTVSQNGWVEFSCPAYRVQNHQARLYDVTGSNVIAVGSSLYNRSSEDIAVNVSLGGGPVTAGHTYRIEHQCKETRANTGFGAGTNQSWSPTVFTRVRYWAS